MKFQEGLKPTKIGKNMETLSLDKDSERNVKQPLENEAVESKVVSFVQKGGKARGQKAVRNHWKMMPWTQIIGAARRVDTKKQGKVMEI